MPNSSTPWGTDTDNVPVLSSLQSEKIARITQTFDTVASLVAALGRQRTNAHWVDKLRIYVASEPAGFYRLFHRDATIANSHARDLYFGALSLSFASGAGSDDQTVLTTTGVPSGGTGADGNYAYDSASAIIYKKTSGTWAAFAMADGSPLVQPARSANSTIALTDRKSVIPVTAASTHTIPLDMAADSNFQFEINNRGAFSTVLGRAAGVTLVSAGATVTTVTITADGSSILVRGSGTANKFYVDKIGA